MSWCWARLRPVCSIASGIDRSGCPRRFSAVVRSALRGVAVRRLLALRQDQRLTSGHVRVAADALGASERTVWRWLAEGGRD